MKKFLKLSMIISIILIMLLSNISYATNSIMDTLTNEVADEEMVEKALKELRDSATEDGIMPISNDMLNFENIAETDIFLIEQNISVEQSVNGNIYLIGENININSGTINGNVFVIGEDVTIKGSISGSVYVIARDAKIETNTVNTVYALAENATLAENSNVIFDFDVIAKKLDIQGNVNRMLNAAVDILEIAQTAEYIGKGKVVYTGECTGKTDLLDYVELVKKEKEEIDQEVEEEILTDEIQRVLINIVTASIIIAILFLIVKNKDIEKSEDYGSVIGMGIFKGLLFVILVPLISIALLFTIVGVPIGLFMIVLYIIALYISMSVASLKVGQMIYEKTSCENKAITILFAIGVYAATRLIALIPFISLINGLFALFGLGTLMKWMFEKKKEKKDIIVNEE
jgi:hypothetical protein